MNIVELVEHCLENGIYLFVENGNLKAQGNQNQIQILAPTLKERKADLVQYLEYINKRPSEPYEIEPLSRYFAAEGWSYEGAIDLARGMIERGSFLSAHEHEKYLRMLKKTEANIESMNCV